jgi:hypothetical protein
MRMLFKEIRVLVISVNGASAEIMLGQDMHPFRLGDVIPAIGKLQVLFEKTFQRFYLHRKAIPGMKK